MPTFCFNEYKSYLINYFRWGCDNGKNNERTIYLNNHYSDDYLTSIINNTQEFISVLLTEMNKEQKTYKDDIFHEIELPLSYGERGYYISNGCHGGWHADTLFYINDEDKKFLISEYLIKTFFGDKFQIYLGERQTECFNSDEQVGCNYSIPTFNICGPITEFNEIYNNELSQNGRNLILVLKKIKDKKLHK